MMGSSIGLTCIMHRRYANLSNWEPNYRPMAGHGNHQLFVRVRITPVQHLMRHSPEAIVTRLRQVEVTTSEGKSIASAVMAISVTETTFYRWRSDPQSVQYILPASTSKAMRSGFPIPLVTKSSTLEPSRLARRIAFTLSSIQ